MASPTSSAAFSVAPSVKVDLQPRLSDLKAVGLVLLKAPPNIIAGLLVKPFTGYGKSKTVLRVIYDKLVQSLLDNIDLRQTRLIFGTSTETYVKCVRSKGFSEIIEDVGEGARLMWVGEKKTRKVILYLHGGAFFFTSASPDYWDFVRGELKKRGIEDVGLAMLNYTFVPDATFPHQLKQGSAAIKHLIKSGARPSDIFLVGDSAGGAFQHQIWSHILHPHPDVEPLVLDAPLGGSYLMSPWSSLSDRKGRIAALDKAKLDILTATCADWGELILKDISPSDLPYVDANAAPDGWYKNLDKVAVSRVLTSAGGVEVLRDEILEQHETLKKYHPKAEIYVQDYGVHNDPYWDILLKDFRVVDLTKKIIDWLQEPGTASAFHCLQTTTTTATTAAKAAIDDSTDNRSTRSQIPAQRRGRVMGGVKWSADSMIAGAGGGLVASVATCPLDVVKTKLQAQRAIKGQVGYEGVFGTLRTILTDNGLRGLYRGLGPTILGYLPTWAIYFAVYDGIKSAFGEEPILGLGGGSSDASGDRVYPAAQVKGYQPVMREHPWSLHILSAMTAGAASTICTNPLWVIKTRFMTQGKHEVRYKHTLDAAVTIWRTEGISAFYRGLVPSLLGILHVAVQFPLYEQLKRWTQTDPDVPLTAQQILICTAISKMTASVATYPHEVIRTRLQTQRRPLADDMSSDGMVKQHPRGGIISTTVKLIRKEGWPGLYKGLSVNLIRTVPNSAVTMLTYELVMRQLAKKRKS